MRVADRLDAGKLSQLAGEFPVVGGAIRSILTSSLRKGRNHQDAFAAEPSILGSQLPQTADK
jgi:hypothetical protein